MLVAGFKHRVTPLGIFERMTLSAAEIPKALRRLASSAHMAEVAILATCNRTEVYAVSGNFHGAMSDINRFFMELSGRGQAEFAEHLFSAYNEIAVHHLFSVTAGLDSAVVGETEILGQVRMAFKAAEHGDVTGPHLSTLFRHALTAEMRRIVMDDSFGIGDDLVEMIEHHVRTYACEWAETLADPERLERFASFVNTDEPDPAIVMVRERDQPRPATPAEREAFGPVQVALSVRHRSLTGAPR